MSELKERFDSVPESELGQDQVLEWAKQTWGAEFERCVRVVATYVVNRRLALNGSQRWVYESIQGMPRDEADPLGDQALIDKISMLGSMRPAWSEYDTWVVFGKIKQLEAFELSERTTFEIPVIRDVTDRELLDVGDKSDWHYWNKHHRFLTKCFAPNGEEDGLARIAKIDSETDEILKQMRDPRSGDGEDFTTLGLVIGHVQSGKTANFMGLISKAVSIGYRFVIVLAGTKNDLRQQTQNRLDQELVGDDRFGRAARGVKFADWRSHEISRELLDWAIEGVATPPPAQAGGFWKFMTITGEEDFNPVGQMDFSQVFEQHNTLVVVVKKHAIKPADGADPHEYRGILGKLMEWIRRRSDQAYLPPTLIIDDEADQAGVNSGKIFDENGDELDPSTINGCLRTLVHDVYGEALGAEAQSRQVAFVGYTATPFANVFISNAVNDLYPKDFIVALDVPERYFGLEQYFGSETRDLFMNNCSEDEAQGERDELNDGFMAIGPKMFPERLRLAIFDFFFYCLVKEFRGLEQEKTMMIHTSRLNAEQKVIHDKLERYRDELLKGSISLRDEIEAAWPEFNRRAEDIRAQLSLDALKYPWPDWTVQDLEEKVRELLADKLHIKLVNGPNDRLDYSRDHLDHVIAIGGDILSRGLTLEGLAVSYYLRKSNNYDTLLQMARWFGYRVGYEDLIRVYTSQGISDSFEHLLLVEEDLREEIRTYARDGSTPADFAPRVRAHQRMIPSGRMGVATRVAFSNKLAQTHLIDSTDVALRANYDAVHGFVSDLIARHGDPLELPGGAKKEFRSVPIDEILGGFLEKFTYGTHGSRGWGKDELLSYIERHRNDGLATMDVRLSGKQDLNPGGKAEAFAHGGKSFEVNPVTRGNIRNKENPIPGYVRFGAISDPSDFRGGNPNRPMLALYFVDSENSKYEVDGEEKRVFDDAIDFNPVVFALDFPDSGESEYYQQIFTNNAN